MRKKISLFLYVFVVLIFSSKLYSIEVSQIEAERRLVFHELFSKKTCDTIYKNSTFGFKKKLDREVDLMAYHNIKRINIDETKSILTLFLDQRTYHYNEPGLTDLIFETIAEEGFTEEFSAITKIINEAKTKRIVVCEYDLNRSIKDGKFFDFKIIFDESLNNFSYMKPKILIYYDGTVEYVFKEEEITYSIPGFDYRLYPFDRHEFKFLISSNIFNNLYFERSDRLKILLEDSKKVGFSNISIPGWGITQYISYSNVEPLKDEYSKYNKHSMVSNFIVSRNSEPFFFKFVAPLLGLTILVYFSIFLRLADGRAGLVGTLLFSFIAYHFVTVGRTPELPYVTFLDWIIFMGYATSVIAMLFTCAESYFLRNVNDTKKGVGHVTPASLSKKDKIILNKIRYSYKVILPIVYLIVTIIGYEVILTG